MNKKIFEKIITEKRAKSSNERPKYGLRKLTVGVVSCLLGYMVFMTPNVTLADKVEAKPQAIEAKVESTKANTTEEVEQPAEENTAKPENNSAEQFESQSSKTTSTNAQDRTVRAPEVNTEVAAVSDNEAEKFTAELKPITVEVGGVVDYSKAVTNLPEGAKVTANVDTTQKGEKKVEATIEFKDHSTKVVKITVNVVEKEDALEVGETTGAEDSKQQTPDTSHRADDTGVDTNSQTDFVKEKDEKGEEYYHDKKSKKEYYKKPNWEEPEAKNDGLEKWELHPDQKLREINNISDPVEIGQLNYVGNHKVEEGDDTYTVLDLTYSWSQRAASSVWKNVNMHFSKDFAESIDWTKSGYYYNFDSDKKRTLYKFESGRSGNEKVLYFSQAVQGALGGNVHHTPIRLYLKNKKITDLDNIDTTIQSRITNSDNTEILTTRFEKDKQRFG